MRKGSSLHSVSSWEEGCQPQHPPLGPIVHSPHSGWEDRRGVMLPGRGGEEAGMVRAVGEKSFTKPPHTPRE